MEIINIEKLEGHKVIVMTGRSNRIKTVAREFLTGHYDFMVCYPGPTDYFQDYHTMVADLKNKLDEVRGTVILETQSAEFLDRLLESDLEFIFATIRVDEDNIYRLRVMGKEEALECRRDFGMELRR